MTEIFISLTFGSTASQVDFVQNLLVHFLMYLPTFGLNFHGKILNIGKVDWSKRTLWQMMLSLVTYPEVLKLGKRLDH